MFDFADDRLGVRDGKGAGGGVGHDDALVA
jgi:hypothetical protein